MAAHEPPARIIEIEDEAATWPQVRKAVSPQARAYRA